MVGRFFGRLTELGCSHELLRPRLAAIDLPGEVDPSSVAAVLHQAAQEGVLRFEWADPRPC